MTLSELTNAKRIGFLGFGISCRSVYRFLNRIGNFEFTVRDRVQAPLPFKPESCFYGERTFDDISEDILFVSPSVRRDRPELKRAADTGTVLSSDAELFFSLYKGEAYGVTGTSGKSTVTMLICDMLRASGIPTLPIGNYGTGFLSYLNEPTVSAELSSFQLTYLEPKLRTAVLTNIGEDHLNWHVDREEYIRTKMSILNNAKTSVVDADCELITDSLGDRRVFAAVSTDFSYELLKTKIRAKNYVTLTDCSVLLNGKTFFDISRAARREDYNVKNYMLSAAAVLEKATPKAISNAVNSFQGLPHRCETVAKMNEVGYVNSSIDTSPERAITTISSIKGSKVPIFCGTGKGLSYKRLADITVASCSGAVLMGEVGEAIGKEISGICRSFSMATAYDMRDALEKAETMLGRSGTVILAPAGASYDKYKSFEERGEDFRLAVLERTKTKEK